MSARNKLATLAIAGAFLIGGVAAAVPASATVTQSGCRTGSIVFNAYTGNGYTGFCFNGTGDASPEPNLSNVASFYSGGHTGTFSWSDQYDGLTNFNFGFGQSASFSNWRYVHDLYVVV